MGGVICNFWAETAMPHSHNSNSAQFFIAKVDKKKTKSLTGGKG